MHLKRENKLAKTAGQPHKKTIMDKLREIIKDALLFCGVNIVKFLFLLPFNLWLKAATRLSEQRKNITHDDGRIDCGGKRRRDYAPEIHVVRAKAP